MSDRREMRDLASPERAREVIADLDVDPGTELVPIESAGDLVLAERVDAGLDVPGFDRAAMDGYAVRAADTVGAGEVDPVELDAIGSVPAGERPEVAVSEGEAAEIATGAVLPEGADAVVMVEETDPISPEERGAEAAPASGGDGNPARVAVRSAVTPGENVMAAGADLAAGDRVLGAGTVLSPRTIALLAAVGESSFAVARPPRVALVSTGEELVPPGAAPDPGAGQIYDVNRPALGAGVEAAGGEVVSREHVGDDRAALEVALAEGAEAADLVLTSGSTSAGAADQLYAVLEDIGELQLHGIAVKPGKPTLVGTVEGTPYVGLPGYPVSAQSVFRAFVAPAIRAAARRPEAATPASAARLARSVRYEEGRHRLLPVGIVTDGSGRRLVYPVDKGSGATTSLGQADGIVEMPADERELEAGRTVTVQHFGRDARPPALLCVGERDPVVADALDGVDGPRFVPVGDAEGRRRLGEGVPDAAVVTGDVPEDWCSGDGDGANGGQAVEGAAGGESNGPPATTLAAWRREWGLVVAEGATADGLAALLDEPLSFANRARTSGLRAAFDDALVALADERDRPVAALRDAIDGYGVETHGLESPARRVRDGRADVGLGLRATAATLDLEFVSLGTQTVRAVALAERTAKPGVEQFDDALERAVAAASDRASGVDRA